jgi:hypothetical protein
MEIMLNLRGYLEFRVTLWSIELKNMELRDAQLLKIKFEPSHQIE